MSENIGRRLTFEAARKLDIIDAVFRQLETGLDPRYTYHSARHSEVVLADALMLAQAEGCTYEEQRLIAIAAAFHDAGFLDQEEQNEPFGAMRARAAMEQRQFPEAEIRTVEQMIHDTAIVQSAAGVVHLPHHILSPYLLDADVANLGRATFWEQFELLVRELDVEPKVLARKTVSLFEGLRWLTRTAQGMWGPQTERNLESLKALVDS